MCNEFEHYFSNQYSASDRRWLRLLSMSKTHGSTETATCVTTACMIVGKRHSTIRKRRFSRDRRSLFQNGGPEPGKRPRGVATHVGACHLPPFRPVPRCHVHRGRSEK